MEPKPDEASKTHPHSRLTIDWDAIARSLGGNGGGDSGSPAPFSSKEKPAALQFGNSWQSGPGIGSGGPGGGDNVAAFGGNAFFDSRGYDITPWAKRLVYRIKRNWLYPPAVDYGLRGQVELYMVIEKTGAISTLALVKSSMIQPFDQSAVNAMRLSIPLPPLPSDFPNRNLPAYFIFRFN
jgi:TonB family protein